MFIDNTIFHILRKFIHNVLIEIMIKIDISSKSL